MDPRRLLAAVKRDLDTPVSGKTKIKTFRIALAPGYVILLCLNKAAEIVGGLANRNSHPWIKLDKEDLLWPTDPATIARN